MTILTKLVMSLVCTTAMGSALAVFPADRPVTMIVPFAAGGPTDKVARELGNVMSKHLKQQMIVENLGGAGGTIGVKKVVAAKPDGYTLSLHHIGMATAPSLYKNLGFDPTTALEPIGLIVDVPMVLIANKAVPANNFKELMPYLKANVTKVNLADAGVGSASNLCGLLFKSTTGLNLTTVPYKGTQPALTDLIGGQVQLLCDQTTNIAGQLGSKSVKAYGATTAARIPAFKDIPTLGEQGMKGFEVTVWHALYAPKGTPKEAVQQLSAALQASLNDTTFKSKMYAMGAVVVPASQGTPAALAKHLRAEINKWGPIIKKAGIQGN